MKKVVSMKKLLHELWKQPNDSWVAIPQPIPQLIEVL